jgi:restriction system protein
MQNISESDNLLHEYRSLISNIEESLKKSQREKGGIEDRINQKIIENKTINEKIQMKTAELNANLRTILQSIKYFKSYREKKKIKDEITRLKKREDSINNDILSLEISLQKIEKNSKNLLSNIQLKKGELSAILSQKEKGLELFDNKWVKIEDILKLREIKIGLENNFSNISPFDFELFIARLLQELGYKTEVTRKTSDFGIDIIAQKQNKKVAVQCKRHDENNLIGNKYIQQLLGSMNYVDANHSIFITTSYFTKNAIQQAKNSPIELWDKDTLHNLVKKHLLYLDINEIFTAIESQKREERERKKREKQEIIEKSREKKKIEEEERIKIEIKAKERKAIENKKRICPRCGGGKMKTRKICSKCKREIQSEKRDGWWNLFN